MKKKLEKEQEIEQKRRDHFRKKVCQLHLRQTYQVYGQIHTPFLVLVFSHSHLNLLYVNL